MYYHATFRFDAQVFFDVCKLESDKNVAFQGTLFSCIKLTHLHGNILPHFITNAFLSWHFDFNLQSLHIGQICIIQRILLSLRLPKISPRRIM